MSSPLRNSLIYGLGGVLARAVSFVMQPVYTHYITPAEYAKYSLVIMTVEVVGIAVSAGMTAGFLRFYYKAQGRGRDEVTVSALMLNAGLNAIGSIVLFTAAVPLAQLTIAAPQDAALFRLLAGVFLAEPFIAVPLLVLQARHQATRLVSATVVRTAVAAALNFSFLSMGMGVRGMVLGSLLTSAFLAVLLSTQLLRSTGWAWSARAARDLRRFGIPYQLVAAGSFILAFGDRYVMRLYRPMDEVGLYAFGYQFGFLLWSLTAAPFLTMWTPLRHQALGLPAADRDANYSRGLRIFSVVLIGGAVGLSLVIRPTLFLLTATPYHGAAAFVPVVLAAYVIQGWAEVVQFGIDASERTKFATIAFWGATVVTLSLYFVLIPRLGAWGAALATLLGFLVRFGLTYWFAQRLFPIAYQWSRVLAGAGLGVCTVLVSGLAHRHGMAAQLAAAAILMTGFSLAIWFAVFNSEDQRDARMVLFVGLRQVRSALGAKG